MCLCFEQLRIEQRRGHVFEGWNEGRIYFPPTYKYSKNSDSYAGADTYLKEKRRTPAWYILVYAFPISDTTAKSFYDIIGNTTCT